MTLGTGSKWSRRQSARDGSPPSGIRRIRPIRTIRVPDFDEPDEQDFASVHQGIWPRFTVGFFHAWQSSFVEPLPQGSFTPFAFPE